MKPTGESVKHFRVWCGQDHCDRAISAAPEDIQQVVIKKSGEFALVIARVPALATCDRPDCGEALSQNTTGHPTEIDWLLSQVDHTVVTEESSETPVLFPRRFAE
jgi:hypothetical protein